MGSKLRYNYRWKFIQSHSFPRARRPKKSLKNAAQQQLFNPIIVCKIGTRSGIYLAALNINQIQGLHSSPTRQERKTDT
jgi:hypothetical protein